MRIRLDVSLLFTLVHFSSEVLHYCARVVVLGNLNHTPEIQTVRALSGQGRTHSDDDLEVFIGRSDRLRVLRVAL
jgi:hypothetical protein